MKGVLRHAPHLIMTAVAVLSAEVLANADGELAEQVRLQTLQPVRPGKPGERPFWNANAEWFMYAPAFDFRETACAANYRFRVLDDCHVSREFVAAKPYDSLQPVWAELPAGFATVTCFALDAKGKAIGLAGERTFWKSAPFRGGYPKAKRPHADAVRMGLEYLLDRKANRYFLENGKPDPSYDLNCYPAKMHAATIRAMCDYLKLGLPRKDEALKLARLCADYLIGIAEPEGRPLAGWPHTYEGTANTAAEYAGQQMLVYPAAVGNAYLSLYETVKDAHYLAEARRIAATYLKLQGEDGTWYLKLYEKDGKPVSGNRLMPNGVIDFLERLHDVTGEERYRAAADRAFAYIDRGPLETWNWEGQFEDVPPSEPYFNLTKHFACDTAIYLLKRFPGDARRVKQAEEILRWAEDQFIAWEVPARKDGIGFRNRPGFKSRWAYAWQHKYSIWHCPAVMEQYSWYQPIDASAAKLIRTYLAYYAATGDALAFEKAKTLGNAVVNNQRDDGLSPTGWFGNYDEYHNWINCHIAAMQALQSLCSVERGAADDVRRDETARLQRAIDATAAVGGGRVVVSKGVHPCGTLYLKSNVELHLEDGAELRGGGKPSDYDDAIPVDEVYSYEGAVPATVTRKAFVYAENATNIAITGKGVINGCGQQFFDQKTWAKPTHLHRPRMVVFRKCRGIRLEDTTFKDSPLWTMWLRRCEDIVVSRIRIDADQRMINTDGIDFDACRNVRVGDSSFSTGDDCFAIRAIRHACDTEEAITEDLVVSNCVLSTTCQGVRIACPSDRVIRNAVFRDITFTGNNAIFADQQRWYLEKGDTGSIVTQDILFENWKIDCSGSAISAVVTDGVTLGDFGHMTFRNIEFKAGKPIRICGNATTVVRDMVLENVRGKVNADKPFVFTRTENLRTANFHVNERD